MWKLPTLSCWLSETILIVIDNDGFWHTSSAAQWFLPLEDSHAECLLVCWLISSMMTEDYTSPCTLDILKHFHKPFIFFTSFLYPHCTKQKKLVWHQMCCRKKYTNCNSRFKSIFERLCKGWSQQIGQHQSKQSKWFESFYLERKPWKLWCFFEDIIIKIQHLHLSVDRWHRHHFITSCWCCVWMFYVGVEALNSQVSMLTCITS